jgi:hypothetical protein
MEERGFGQVGAGQFDPGAERCGWEVIGLDIVMEGTFGLEATGDNSSIFEK